MISKLLPSLCFIFCLAFSMLVAQEAVDRNEEIKKLKAELADESTAKEERHMIEKKIAQSYLALNDFEKVIEHMSNSISLQEKAAETEYTALARLLLKSEKDEEAIALLREGQRKHPKSMDMAFLLTFPFREAENWEAAVKQYEKIENLAVTQTPEGLNHRIYFQYGATVERSGDIDRAAQLFQKALERIPEGGGEDEDGFRATILNYLGYMWVDSDKNIDVAGELIKKAAKLDPNSGAIADSLGWFYFKKERYIEAMNELVRAEAMMEERDPTVMDHIAQTFYKIGNKSEAVSYMKKALEVEPDNKEYQDRLKQYTAKNP